MFSCQLSAITHYAAIMQTSHVFSGTLCQMLRSKYSSIDYDTFHSPFLCFAKTTSTLNCSIDSCLDDQNPQCPHDLMLDYWTKLTPIVVLVVKLSVENSCQFFESFCLSYGEGPKACIIHMKWQSKLGTLIIKPKDTQSFAKGSAREAGLWRSQTQSLIRRFILSVSPLEITYKGKDIHAVFRQSLQIFIKVNFGSDMLVDEHVSIKSEWCCYNSL